MKRLALGLGVLVLCLFTAAAQAQSAPPSLTSATVSLPLNDLRALLDKSEPDKAPVDYILSNARVGAKIEGKTAATITILDITLLTERWTLIPLGPVAGTRQVTIDDKPAAIVQRNGTLCILLSGKTTPKATVEILGERKPAADGPLTRLELPLPPAPLVAVSATIDRLNLDVKAANGTAVKVAEEKDHTTLTAGYQGDQPATLTWRAKPAADAAATVKITPTTLTRVAISRGIIRYLAQVHYDIPQGETDTLKLALPDGVEFTSASGNQVRDTQVLTAADKSRTLLVTLAEPARDGYILTVLYEQRFDDKLAAPTVALLHHPDAAADAGSIGLEVRGGGYELVPTVTGASRVDVRELPEGLWSSAHSPLLFGYRYDAPKDVKIALGLTRHADVDVLVAMSDVAEAATTITPDGKAITKVMYVTRNNLKQFMTLKLPEGAQLWSAFVDDRPVTPVKSAKGEILIPLKKSDTVESDDDTSYRAQRDKRRAEADNDHIEKLKSLRARQAVSDDEPADLKPYDVEIVYVLPATKLEEKGQLKLALPQSDVPIGKLAWAVFLPSNLRVVDSQGNLSEVSHFSLGFRHFADVAWAKQQRESLKMAAADLASAKQEQLQNSLAEALGAKAKAEGVLPVRVELPISGDISRFEKLLTVDETPTMTLIYNRRAN